MNEVSGQKSIFVTQTAAATSQLTVTDTSELAVGMPFFLYSNVGGLVSGVSYFIHEIVDSTHLIACDTAPNLPGTCNVCSLFDESPVNVEMVIYTYSNIPLSDDVIILIEKAQPLFFQSGPPIVNSALHPYNP